MVWQRTAAGAFLLAFTLAGVAGPSLTPNGAASYSGKTRAEAAFALAEARLILETPIERLLVRALRIVRVNALPPGTRDHLDTCPCLAEFEIDAYTIFWIPYARVVTRCGATSATR